MKTLITEEKDLEVVYAALSDRDRIGIDLETTGLGVRSDDTHGIAVGNEDGEEFYITGSALVPAWNMLEHLDQTRKPLWIGHNIGFDLHFMERSGFIPKNIDDTMIMQWLLDSSEQLALKSLATWKLGYTGLPSYTDLRNSIYSDIKSIQKEIKEWAKEEERDPEEHENAWALEISKPSDVTIDIIFLLEPETLTEYACMDIEITLKLWHYLKPRLDAEDMQPLHEEKEIPFVKLLTDMESHGMLVDIPYVEGLKTEYEERLEQLFNKWNNLTREHMARHYQRSADLFHESFQDLLSELHPEHIKETHDKFKVMSRKRMNSVEELMDDVDYLEHCVEQILDGGLKEDADRYDAVIRSIDSHLKRFEGVAGKDDERIVQCKRVFYVLSVAVTGVNPNSTPQLAELFFEAMGFDPTGHTDAGNPSTDSLAIVRLNRQANDEEKEVLDTLVDTRLYGKMISTYISAFLDQNLNKRIHCSLNQTGTETTRLSASRPNLQNIPSKDDIGEEIRRAFIAPPGYKLVVCDFSQIEMRLIAHYCKDEAMLAVFAEGRDPHDETQKRLGFEHRVEAKTINFGMPYGMGPIGYANALEKAGRPRPTMREAEDAVYGYDEAYPGWSRWKNKVYAWARKLGYVQTIAGHRRYLPDINSPIMSLRSAAERKAPNAIIQGSAADLIKEAMLNIWWQLDSPYHDNKSWFPGARMVMQVHDELIFECPENMVESFMPFVQYEMERVGEIFNLSVDIIAEPNAGYNWSEAK